MRCKIGRFTGNLLVKDLVMLSGYTHLGTLCISSHSDLGTGAEVKPSPFWCFWPSSLTVPAELPRASAEKSGTEVDSKSLPFWHFWPPSLMAPTEPPTAPNEKADVR
jgi:hypothetical protein